jgi:urease accessory protein
MSDTPLPRATAVHRAGTWPEDAAHDVITLDFDDRHRRRRYVGEGGFAFLVDLPEAVVLRDGDGLALEDGSFVLVRAAPEPLIEVTAESADRLACLAWHLGNRHLPAEIGPGRILIRDDHVIVHMLEGLGAQLRRVQAPFNPEGGAYGEHNRNPEHHHHHHHEG